MISIDTDPNAAARKTKIKKEPNINTTNGQCMTTIEGQGDPADLKDEPGDFIETNCHWRECGTEFPTQDDLVKVRKYINPTQFHFQSSNFLAYKQRPHTRQQKIVCMSMGRLLKS